MATHSHDVKKEVRAYFAVLIALIFLTGITVGVSYIPFVTVVGIGVGLLIALLKGSLVALIFMHLKAERRWIYWSLALTVFFFLALIALPLWTLLDQVGHTGFMEVQGE